MLDECSLAANGPETAGLIVVNEEVYWISQLRVGSAYCRSSMPIRPARHILLLQAKR